MAGRRPDPDAVDVDALRDLMVEAINGRDPGVLDLAEGSTDEEL